VRTHPAVVAQAAATSSVLLGGRFVLGVGSGEALNEHVVGGAWPTAEVRLEMLEEAIEVIRKLWTGAVVNHRGPHYTVDSARIYTLPEQPPPIYVSGFGPNATDLAARVGDGYISTKPDGELVRRFRENGGGRKPAQVGLKVSYAATEQEGVEIAHRLWPNSAVPGELAQVLPSPQHFEQAAELVTPEMLREKTPCGSDPDVHLAAFEPFLEAGYDEFYVANMGPHYKDMLELYGASVLPALRERLGRSPRRS
jgi:G6PDH family F420-dependent oxidoreductase